MRHHYKNLIFDVGGVLLDYRWEAAIADAGISMEEAKRIGFYMFKDPLWQEFDLGNMAYDEVVDAYCKKYPEDEEPIRYFLTHPENMPLDRPQVWEKIHALKEDGYKIYLLSNYSEYMFKAHTDGKPFWKDVDGAVVSYMVHRIKPDHEIYFELIRRYKLRADQCLFFDDRIENAQAAADIDMDCAWVPTIEELFERLGEL